MQSGVSTVTFLSLGNPDEQPQNQQSALGEKGIGGGKEENFSKNKKGTASCEVQEI